MINQHVIDYLVALYNFLKGTSLSFFAAGFTIYFAVMKLTDKIIFSHSIRHTFLEPSGELKNFVLKNKRDKTYTITKLICRFSDNNVLVIKKFNPPLLLKPYETTVVEFEEISYWQDKQGKKYEPDFMSPFTVSALIYGGGSVRCTRQNHSDHTNITIRPSTTTFDGFVLKGSMKYIITISTKNEFKNVVILDNGWIHTGREHFRRVNLLNYVQLNVPGIVDVISSDNFKLPWDYYVIYDVQNIMVKAVYDSRRKSE